MHTIHLETTINSPIERCFDLSRSIDLHKLSTAKTNEEAISGCTSGLIELDEWVTWRARHFGIMQKMTVKITQMNAPHHFEDEMLKGAFKHFKHNHYFQSVDDRITLMRDELDFSAPFGIIGRWVGKFILVPYLTKFLVERNEMIKEFAESDKWQAVPGLIKNES